MSDKCLICGEYVPEGRLVCPNCERKAETAKMSRADLRRQQKQKEKQLSRFTVSGAQLEKMVKTAALELLEKGIKDFRDNELQMIRNDVRKILSLNMAIYRDVLGEMGILTRDNVEEVLSRTQTRWDEVNRLIANRNLHELQKYADELGADEDTFLDIGERKGEPREIAEIILNMEDEE